LRADLDTLHVDLVTSRADFDARRVDAGVSRLERDGPALHLDTSSTPGDDTASSLC